MSQPEYADQFSRDLQLNFVEGLVDLEQFTILAEGLKSGRHVEVRYYIIGESHIVVFEMHGKIFTEVFSCAPIKTDHSSTLINAVPLSKLVGISHSVGAVGKWSYSFDCRTDSLSNCARNLLLFREQRVRTDSILEFEFPGQEKEGLPPKTSVTVHCAPGQPYVDVATIHTYPNEDIVVFTHSKMFFVS